MKKGLLLAAALTIAAGSQALFAQSPATCTVAAPVDSSVRAATAALMKNGFFIVECDVASGFVKAKRYTPYEHILSPKLGTRRETAVIVMPAGDNCSDITIQFYEEILNTEPDFRKREGLVEDWELGWTLTAAIKEYLAKNPNR